MSIFKQKSASLKSVYNSYTYVKELNPPQNLPVAEVEVSITN